MWYTSSTSEKTNKINFSQERSDNKSFWEIGSMLSSLQTDIKKEELHSEMSEQLMQNLLDSDIWIKVISKDTLFALNKLLPSSIKATLFKENININIWDIIFIEGNDLVVKKSNWVLQKLWVLIGTYNGKFYVHNKKKSLFVRKYIESSLQKGKLSHWKDKVIRWNSKNIYTNVSTQENSLVSIKNQLSFLKEGKWYDLIIFSWKKHYRVFIEFNQESIKITDPNDILKNWWPTKDIENWLGNYSSLAKYKIINEYKLPKSYAISSILKEHKWSKGWLKTISKEKKTINGWLKYTWVNAKWFNIDWTNIKWLDVAPIHTNKPYQNKVIDTRKVTEKAWVEEKKLLKNNNEELVKNDAIKAIFLESYSKYPLGFISKADLLTLSKRNYYVATAMIMVHRIEQWNGGLVDLRKMAKNLASSSVGEPLYEIFEKDGVKSRWEFQIRYTKENLWTDDLKTFFWQYKKWEYKELSVLWFLNTIMASIYLRKRFDKTLKYYPQFTEELDWDSNKHFSLLSTTLEAYHKWPSWGLKSQVFINSTLKLGERFWIYNEDSHNSFQLQVRKDTKTFKVWNYRLESDAFWSVEFYKRGKILFTIALNKIREVIIRDEAQVKERLTELWEKDLDKVYSNILSWLKLPLDISKFSMYHLDKKLSQSIDQLSKVYGVNFIDFTIEDYMNTDPIHYG